MSTQTLFLLATFFYASNEFIAKRQSGYVATDNIYGYDYRSSPSDENPARLIVNPNYAFLNDSLSSGYSQNYVKAETAYAHSSGVGNAPSTFLMNDALLSNDQQNSINYQRIQQTTYNRPSSAQQYPDNIYGYAYSDTPVRSGPQIQRGQTTTPPSYTQVPPALQTVGSQTRTAPYQSVADLKTTRLRDPSRNTLYFDSMASSSNAESSNQAMYYPYRTATQNVGVQGSGGSGVTVMQYDGSQMVASTLFRDPNTDPCSLPDPYWCSDYVKIYLNSTTTFGGFSRQAACQPLAMSLQDSYNGCCQTLRAAGCRT
ncbi:unnamed protein product [Cylicocyclus nassatus]|uniref:Uncharacterized protein n=1 Tax=Cylicocyclus nassatus TaxID=53992 RepID=A0AA36GBV7_CYLNA|nr:unnamed protein product [Cylicocyclus nassatus]